MELLRMGEVIIIDDHYQEAKPIIKYCIDNYISKIYINKFGPDDLPTKPIPNVRVVFLDLELNNAAVSDKNKAANAVGILKRIISQDNGWFILIAWTQHQGVIEYLNDYLKSSNFSPVLILDLEKSECIAGNDNNLKVDRIAEKLKSELSKLGVFHLFMEWEEIVKKSAVDITRDFSSFYDFDVNWNDNLSNLFYKLAQAQVGQQLDDKKESIIKNSFLTFNSTFQDILEKRLFDLDCSDIVLDIKNERIEQDLVGKINSQLLISCNNLKQIEPGNVYLNDKGIKSKDYLNDDVVLKIFKTEKKGIQVINKKDGKLLDEYKNEFDLFFDKINSTLLSINIEVTPTCDYSQDKWLRSRLVPGFLCPKEYERSIISGDYLKKSPHFTYNEKLYFMVFDLRSFYSQELDERREKVDKPIFRVRHNLLVDIQSKLAQHISRPGVLFLDERY